MAIEPIERLIGIDFGTSTSVVCCMRYQNGEPLGGDLHSIKFVEFEGLPMVPTLVQRIQDDFYCGVAAKQPRHHGDKTSTLYCNFKMQLESADPDEREQARMLTEKFFEFLHKAYAAQMYKLGSATEKEHTYISYPVNWSQETKDFLCQTAAQAGFPNVEGIDEAQAAIHAVLTLNKAVLQKNCLFQNRKPALVLLIDMGAGTTDLVLCRCPSPNQMQVLCTWPQEGSTFFGGREVDERLFQYLFSTIPPTSTENIEKIKKHSPSVDFKSWKENTVSGALKREETVTEFSMWTLVLDAANTNSQISLDRKEFENFMADYLRQFPQLVHGCLQSGNVRPEDLDLVVLTGGHSQWYFVEELLLDQLPLNGSAPLGLTKIKNDSSRICSIPLPQETVAMGLAYMGLRKEEPEPIPEPIPEPAPQPEPKVQTPLREGDIVSPSPEESADQNTDFLNISELYYQAQCGDAEAQFKLGRVCMGRISRNEVDARTDPTEPLKWFLLAATQGHTGAQFQLGNIYKHGVIVKANKPEAVRWYRMAAEQGHARAQCNLGACYEYGDGVAKNPVEAVKWYRAAAEQGYAKAQCYLGYCYDDGIGVPKSPVEAAKWYRTAAEQGYAKAQYILGGCYEHGDGVPEDLAEASKWFLKAAEQGFSEAQSTLGYYYGNGIGVAKNLEESAKWHLKAATQGHIESQRTLGEYYWNGIGVTKNLSEAAKWFLQAAKQGDIYAQYKLGDWYEDGIGVTKNLSEAAKWFLKAADQSNAYAQYKLAIYYANGTGVAKNLVEAAKWYRAAAEQEHTRAQYELGICYLKGNGVKKDVQKGQEWCNKAIANGYKPSIFRRLFHV